MRFELKKITPAYAKQLLTLNTHNRVLNRERVAAYADAMKRGQWRLTHQGLSLAPQAINDGQHRLNAVIVSGCTIEFMVCYEENTDNFKVIDTGKNRSGGDVLSIEGVKNAASISSGIAKYLRIRVGSTDTESALYKKRITNTDILSEYMENPEFWQRVFRHAKSLYQHARLYTIGDVMAYTAYLHKYKEYELEYILKFFSELFGYIQTSESNVIMLRNMLIRDAFSVNKLNYRHKAQLLKRTWNHYLVGAKLTKLIVDQNRVAPIEFE